MYGKRDFERGLLFRNIPSVYMRTVCLNENGLCIWRALEI